MHCAGDDYGGNSSDECASWICSQCFLLFLHGNLPIVRSNLEWKWQQQQHWWMHVARARCGSLKSHLRKLDEHADNSLDTHIQHPNRQTAQRDILNYGRSIYICFTKGENRNTYINTPLRFFNLNVKLWFGQAIGDAVDSKQETSKKKKYIPMEKQSDTRRTLFRSVDLFYKIRIYRIQHRLASSSHCIASHNTVRWCIIAAIVRNAADTMCVRNVLIRRRASHCYLLPS